MPGNGLAKHTTSISGPTANTSGNRQRYRGGVDKYDLETGLQFKETLSWADVPAASIVDAVVAVTGVGDALMFSRTSDGGAYSITVMSGGKAAKVWPSDPDGANDVLLKLIERAAAP